MKTLENFTLVGISMLLVAGLAACSEPGPAETAGKKLDDAANKAGMKIEETVDKVGEKLSEKSDKVSVAIDDAEITAKVKSAVFSDSGLNTLRISVDTIKSVVTLTGSVNSQSELDRAKALAESVAGVIEVKNYLQVIPSY